MFPVSIDFIYSLHYRVVDVLNKNHLKKKDSYDEQYDYMSSALVSLKRKLRDIIDDHEELSALGHEGTKVIISSDLVKSIRQAKV